jgi:alpha-mannosidase
VTTDADARVLARLERVPLTVSAWEVPDEPVPSAEAFAASYRPVTIGHRWGRPWGTTWFRVEGDVPEPWDLGTGDIEIVVDLGFTSDRPGFQAEALAFDDAGAVLKSVQPGNRHLPLPRLAGRRVVAYLEAASNPDLGGGGNTRPTPMGLKETAGDAPLYVLGRVDVARRDREVWELLQDIAVLRGLADMLPADRPRRARILHAFEEMLDQLDPADVAGTVAVGRKALDAVLAAPAAASAHTVLATGHAHIDSAWLWPTRETVRKCARTFSNVLDLIDADPDFVFACSSAQQYAWVEQGYPQLFARIRDAVARGRFVPVGGMWVESDTNMPGGEALARQFVEGKRYFFDRFGVEPHEVWLPDSFGYSAALPQIAVAAGARWFLTQKISWNDTNTMPHHTFSWEGIDGTRIYTHFPPADTYNSDLSAVDLDRAERQFADKARASLSLLPFGYGNGGGGPTREMLAAAHRQADLEGSPKVRLGAPVDFFTAAEDEYPDPAVWSGELYLELHRGTLTSQARTKRGNRRNEHLLREAEWWSSSASVLRGWPYPHDELDELWRSVLLMQFHDILPGSSIAWVHRDAERQHEQVTRRLVALIDGSMSALAGTGETELVANPAPVPASDGTPAGAIAAAVPRINAVTTWARDDGFVLENGRVRVEVDADGLLASVVDIASGREVVPSGSRAGMLQLFRDIPNRWDAWDVDAHDLRTPTELTSADAVKLEGSEVVVRRRFGASTIVETIGLRPGAAVVDFTFDIDWRERQKLLKLAFPVQVHAPRFASETQFGHVFRSTHRNTSWDEARFEVCAHRWIHVEEPGFGVGIANDSTYGHDVTTFSTPSGPATTIRLSLLRAPLFPDPEADQGAHRLRAGLVVGAGIAEMVAEGYRLNQPVRRLRGAGAVAPLASVEPGAIVLETVKLAYDRSGDLVLRLYESRGGVATTMLRSEVDLHGVRVVDLLERPVADQGALVEVVGPREVRLRLRGFQLVTLRAGVAVGDAGLAGTNPSRSSVPE